MTAKSQEILKQIAGLTLMEAADLVKAMEAEFGISAAAPAAVASAAPAAAAAAPAAAEAKAEYKVTLTDGGAKKIEVIKVVKAATGLGLTEAKKAVEEAPTVLAEAMPKAEAQALKEKVEAAGGKVELA